MADYPLLSQIQNPQDLKALREEDLLPLAAELRARILQVTSKNGGHVGPNLGLVELTIALHRHFNTPEDCLVFDVAHQAYAHKLLTARNNKAFDALRQTGGLSGFAAQRESPHDSYGAGHAGTALSAALGMACARDRQGLRRHIIAIIGDAALTCGIPLEALNNIKSSTQKLIVILNDNQWSIAPNVGAIPRYLNELITNKTYNRLHENLESFLNKVPGGLQLTRLGKKIKIQTKDFVTNHSSLFEKYGLRYIGPIDGHNFKLLNQYLEFCKRAEEPILLHLITQKGRGFPFALKDPETFHGTSAFSLKTGRGKTPKIGTPPTWQKVFGQTILQLAEDDPRLIGITAAMPSGTSLKLLKDTLPQQYFDVGIAEEHAVLFAAGLASLGMRPVCAIYSTFLQRAYDPIIHDICLQKLNVTFCMDRSGLSPNDGATHHGLFDIAYLRCIPELILMQPRHEDELADMIYTALTHEGPAFVRYPRGQAPGVKIKDTPIALPLGKASVLEKGDGPISLWALGNMVSLAEKVAQQIQTNLKFKATLTNAKFVKPLDLNLLIQQAKNSKLLVTFEDGVLAGGFGSAILEALAQAAIPCRVLSIGWPDRFIPHATDVETLRKLHQLDPPNVSARIIQAYRKLET